MKHLITVAWVLLIVIALYVASRPLKPVVQQSKPIQSESAHPESHLTDQQKIDLLRVEAHQRGISWTIFCTKFREGDPEGFQADAWRTGEGDFHAVALETIDSWAERDLTQASVAYALYQTIQGPPNHPKLTPEELEKKKPFVCPLPDLSGH